MARKATKAAENRIYLARMAAAECNDNYNSREGAAAAIGMDRTRLARIELGSLIPYPEEVLLLSDAFNAPELINYYCTKMCTLGRHTVPVAELQHLDRLTINILSSLGNADFIKHTILEIVKDGKITANEQSQLNEVLLMLDDVAKAIAETKLYFEKNGRQEDVTFQKSIPDKERRFTK